MTLNAAEKNISWRSSCQHTVSKLYEIKKPNGIASRKSSNKSSFFQQ